MSFYKNNTNTQKKLDLQCSNCYNSVSMLFQFDLCKKCLLDTFQKFNLKKIIDSVRK